MPAAGSFTASALSAVEPLSTDAGSLHAFAAPLTPSTVSRRETLPVCCSTEDLGPGSDGPLAQRELNAYIHKHVLNPAGHHSTDLHAAIAPFSPSAVPRREVGGIVCQLPIADATPPDRHGHPPPDVHGGALQSMTRSEQWIVAPAMFVKLVVSGSCQYTLA